MLSTGYVNESFVKRSLTFSITSMVLMASFLALFIPQYDGSLEGEMNDLLQEYSDMTGSTPYAEEIWGLSGIYTPYGTDAEGNPSNYWGTSPDGWVWGARRTSYEPSQLVDLDGGRESYTATYDKDTGLYYYTKAGANLAVETDPDDPQKGTLYASVAMDETKKSSVFFTSGSKRSLENGTFLYDFTGYRYAFSPLRDYKTAGGDLVTATSTSLSLVWYQYYADSGISGQLILSGSDGGVGYITAPQVLENFSGQQSFSAKFPMIFNGINMNIYIKINPYAMQHYTVEECFDNGFWSVMVTSPSVADPSNGLVLNSFSPDRVVDTIVDLLTFHMEDYGLSGTAATLTSLFFSVSMYTSLIAISLAFWPMLILTALVAAIQAINIFG